jgi:hypothetical protein
MRNQCRPTDERDINVDREWEGASMFFVCADLAVHIVDLCFKLCFAATSSSGLWKICPWLIDSGKVQGRVQR